MIKLIITDIGGVLVKTDEAILSCIEEVFRKNNIPPGSKQDLLKAFGVSIFDYIKSYLPKEHKDKAVFCYEEFKKIYPSKATQLMKVYSGVDETLFYLKKNGIKLCVLSCMIKHEVKTNLSLLNFKDFDLVFSLEDYNIKRPMPDGLNMIMKRVNVLPNETIYVGDTVNDIKMAKNAQVISVAVKTGLQSTEDLKKEHPDYLIDDFSKLKELIDKL